MNTTKEGKKAAILSISKLELFTLLKTITLDDSDLVPPLQVFMLTKTVSAAIVIA